MRRQCLSLYARLRLSLILHGNWTRFAWRHPGRGGLFSLTFYESTATDAAINLAERGSPFSSTRIIRLPSPTRSPPSTHPPRSTLVSLLFTVTVTVTRQLSRPPQRSSDARADSHLPCTHRHLPVMLPSTRHAVYLIHPRGVIIINHVNFTITDVPVPPRRQKHALRVLKRLKVWREKVWQSKPLTRWLDRRFTNGNCRILTRRVGEGEEGNEYKLTNHFIGPKSKSWCVP